MTASTPCPKNIVLMFRKKKSEIKTLGPHPKIAKKISYFICSVDIQCRHRHRDVRYFILFQLHITYNISPVELLLKQKSNNIKNMNHLIISLNVVS